MGRGARASAESKSRKEEEAREEGSETWDVPPELSEERCRLWSWSEACCAGKCETFLTLGPWGSPPYISH